VQAALAKPLDWCTIQLARLNVRDAKGTEGLAAKAQALLERPDFLGDFIDVPEDFQFVTKRAFQFTSPVASPWKRNNTVHGRLYTASKVWRDKPTVVLLHGWNANTAYRTLFPHLARRLTKRGVNVAMFELPYHSQRKPRGKGAASNFLSGDLVHVVQATHQAIADAQALVAWLKGQGCPRVGLWGISLGAWLSGLLACAESRVDFAVLMTPVVRMDRLIAEVDFCAPIRRSLGSAKVRFDSMNLKTRQPKILPEDILVVASQHDLFAPIETVEELCEVWGVQELWRPRHGHISVLMSMPVMERTVRWVTRKAEQTTRRNG
jgi:dienelactone hydrolase